MRSLKCVFLYGSIVKFSILSVSLLLFAFCFSNPTHAATYSASLSTSSSLTINASGVGNGTSVGVDNLTVTSTCPSGYNVTIEGPSDTNLYLNGNSSNNASGTYIAHSTGTTSSPATITGANKGTWGYSTTSSTGTGTFIGLTNTATTLVSKNSASASGGDAIPVYYGVSLPDGIAPGTYQMPGTSAITYYLTRSDNCVSYLVSFNANGGSGTAMSNQRIYEDQATALSANTYTAPTGKIFKEWNTAADGSGTSYSDGQSVTNIATAGATLTLYAQWIIPDYIQDMSFSECSTTPKTVYDKRDMNAYTVAKLADGNCWMTKNLNLAGGTQLSSDDTDFDSSYTLPSTNGWTTSGDKLVLPSSDKSSSSFSIDNYAYVYNTGNETDNCSDSGCYSYYSWDAATLGSGRSVGTDNVNAPYSICPKGWHLPSTYNGTDEETNFRGLMIAYGGLSSISKYDPNTSPTGASIYSSIGPGTTPNFLLTGDYYAGSFYSGGRYGYYWSSTSSTSTSTARLMSPAPTVINSAFSDNRKYGYAVRCMKEDPSLYNKVEKMSKGKQTNDTNATTGIKVNPTAPTSSVTVSPNSGVYEYNSSVFGEDSDGTKSDGTKAKIYYYHGILDSYGNTNTYGSAGKSDAYPNYVILQTGDSKATTDTCWRIIRTTGSGGVKMIYNGTWTGSTCANSQANAMIKSPVTTSTFDGAASNTTTSRQIVRVGYTYNNTYANTNTTASTAFDTVMGSNTNYSVNNTDSTIKGNVETWFNNTLSDFDDADMFEPSAGYCNDRLGYTSGTASTLTTSIRPYTTSTTTGATYNSYFAGYQRNLSTTQSPSLGCSNSRNIVDVYSTDTSAGGNGQLGAPVGLITADEASFAGSGSSTASQGSGYSATSFLRNGSTFWTMTPYYRYSRYAYNIYMNTNGYMASSRIDTANGIRPVVSLKEGTAPTSGTGISTDPWVITNPDYEPTPDPISCASNKICYAPNSYDNSVVGTMGQQDANASTETMLLASNFSREGYGFAGWNTEPDYSGTFYGPQETITTPSDMSSGLSLYAVWVKSKGYLQDSSKTRSVCRRLTTAPTDGTANLSSVSALTDQRDNETYAIAKLADGNCWMIENLRLDNTNSDNSTGALSQGYATGFIGLADPEAPWAYNSTTANSLYSTDGSTSVTISGSSPAYRIPRYNNVNTPSTASDRPQNPTQNSSTNSTTNAGMYSYGNYYTWTAASTDTSTTSTGDYNTKSICPTGWSIPRGGNKSREATNDFWKYIVTNLNGGTNPANYDSGTQPYYNGTAEAGPVANALRSYPNNFVYSGFIYSSSVNGRGSDGDYWSSTASLSSNAYYLTLYSSNVYPGTYSSAKSGGRSVRCIVPSS